MCGYMCVSICVYICIYVCLYDVRIYLCIYIYVCSHQLWVDLVQPPLEAYFDRIRHDESGGEGGFHALC
jgi:hypothetical protein